MKPTIEADWLAISRYLDEVLELEPAARVAWLEALRGREPGIAPRIGAYLRELEELAARNFLDSSGIPILSEATLTGHRFGSYTLERPIGHGGMGTVWLAHRSDGRFEGQAAVKLLNPALVGHPSERRFAREGNVLAKLRHANIAHLIDAGIAASSQPYLVLEYVQGDRIDRYCERLGLGIEARIRLFLDVLAAVAHAHSNLIVHRDLKPSNILVTDTGVVKLLDFGVAALLSPEATDATHLTRYIAPGLTPGYAAPEQLLGKAVTTATDVYALGIVLFVLLVGEHPAGSEDRFAAELMRLTLDTDAPRPSDVAADSARKRELRGDLDNIVAMALRRNPADRYTTAELLAQDLRRYLALEPVSARPRSIGYLAAKFTRRHRSAVASGIAITLTLVGAVAVTSVELAEARRQRDEARYQARRAESEGEFLDLLFQLDGGENQRGLSHFERLELGVQTLNKQYGGDPKFAGRMLVELADNFRDNNETQRASELYAQAYDMGARNNDPELMAAAQCNRAFGEAFAGILDGVPQRLEEARRLLSRIRHPDAGLQAQCLMAEARFDIERGDVVPAESLLRKAMRVMEDGDSTHRQTYVSVLTELGQIYLGRNQLPQALQMVQRSGEIDDRNGRGGGAGRLIARQNEAVILMYMGEVSASLAAREIINRRLREVESAGQASLAYPVNYAMLLLRMGRPEAALTALDGMTDRARHAGNPFELGMVLLTTGAALIDLGRWDEARAALNEAQPLTSGVAASKNWAAQVHLSLARLELARGKREAAHRHRDESLELAGYRTTAPQRSLPRELLFAAQMALSEGAVSDAERYANDALATATAVSRGPDTSADVGEALLRLAQSRLAAGVTEGTRALLERAVRCLSNGLDPNHPLTAEARNLLADAAT